MIFPINFHKRVKDMDPWAKVRVEGVGTRNVNLPSSTNLSEEAPYVLIKPHQENFSQYGYRGWKKFWKWNALIHPLYLGGATLRSEYLALIVLSSFLKIGVWEVQKSKKIKVLRIENSIRGSLSELKSSLSGLFRPSHLPYKAKSEKYSNKCISFCFHLFSLFPP